MTKTTDEPFERWEIPARLALSDQGVGYHLANPIIADVQAHCVYTGQSPYDAFGSPEEFAMVAAAEQPAHLRENPDRHGLTPGDYLSGGLMSLGLIGLGGSLFYAILEQTLTFPANPAALTGTAFVGLAVFVVRGVPGALRAAGRPRLATASFALVALLAGLAVTAFFVLPREPVIPVPALAVAAVSLLVLLWQLRGPKEPKQPIAHTPPTPRTAGHDTDDTDADAWFRRLAGLLVGRYDLTPQRAGELARQARNHLDTAQGATPDSEFGPVEEYARELAEYEPQRRVPFWRTAPAMLIGSLAGLSLAVSAFLSWSAEGHYWAAYGVALPAALGSAWYAGVYLLRTLRLLRRS
ncbi:hypothetical protein O7623_28670 [Solwaraspora sp. WMMD791]|uniref:hypothetical protein n=1 Tax=Solwaraspora sp. WMMD791 TaxID=3016086 RepID=UPI00249BE02D|nr:hypothetical protein [Solwaraspora sp. WMMD791]WFE27175.1 hypothetical protein O7623_28670 [Solwaraspora sp. WMMD791]